MLVSIANDGLWTSLSGRERCTRRRQPEYKYDLDRMDRIQYWGKNNFVLFMDVFVFILVWYTVVRPLCKFVFNLFFLRIFNSVFFHMLVFYFFPLFVLFFASYVVFVLREGVIREFFFCEINS